MLSIKVSITSRRFLDDIPPKKCLGIVQFILLSGNPVMGSKELRNYPFQYGDFRKYRVIFDIVDDVARILFVGKRNVVTLER